MTAMHEANAAWRVATLLISGCVSMLGCEAMAQQAPITAVYKAQEVSFQYRSSRQPFACHELQNRVANILLSVGARDDIDVNVRNCDVYVMSDDPFKDDPVFGRDNSDPRDRWNTSSGFGNRENDRGQSAHIRIRLMMPVELTPQVLAEIEKDKSRRELISRVNRNPAAAMNEPIVFAAQRQEVTLSNNRQLRLRPEDCELLEQMAFNVFRKLDVKVVRKSFSCGPRESWKTPPQITVEALLPTGQLLPMPDPEKKKTATPGSSEEPKAEPTEPKEETAPQ
jgi:hypothetical protein